MTSLVALAAMLAILLCLAALEFRRHQRFRIEIPHRIHVNGTRGKSSVTRLIGAGLRAGGVRTMTKVTGTFPRLVLPSGGEVPVFRKAAATILEQLDIVRFAVAQRTEALVIECMALEPQYQKLTEEQMVRATLSVMTNVRLDHTDVMGRTLGEIGTSMANTIPRGGLVYTSDNDSAALVQQLARERGATAVVAAEGAVSDVEMERFAYIEHRENVGLAVAVCERLGVERTTALAGMWQADPDPGVLTRSTVERDGKSATLFNGFAANDPDSTRMIWRMLVQGSHLRDERFILLNSRPDRKARSEQLAELVARELEAEIDGVFVMGRPTEAVARILARNGMNGTRVVDLSDAAPQAVLDAVLDKTKDRSSVLAIGNMGGEGANTVELFAEQGRSNG